MVSLPSGVTGSDGRAPQPSLSSSQARGPQGSEQTTSQPAGRRFGADSAHMRAASASGSASRLSGLRREEEVLQRSRMMDPVQLARTRPSYRYATPLQVMRHCALLAWTSNCQRRRASRHDIASKLTTADAAFIQDG